MSLIMSMKLTVTLTVNIDLWHDLIKGSVVLNYKCGSDINCGSNSDSDSSHYTLHTTHYTLHTTHYKLHTTQYTLHTTHYLQLDVVQAALYFMGWTITRYLEGEFMLHTHFSWLRKIFTKLCTTRKGGMFIHCCTKVRGGLGYFGQCPSSSWHFLWTLSLRVWLPF